uniref:Exostosin GT47 domain-containing protein n=1 Tax=Cyclophora tenuis TaxID=216820 RepID=A0A7S1D4H9_CYCTE|mmetsp:Transcript_21326/g.36340  ORF Transcript_21326/g.36340 Transcript_21326/m.36340 type:complete len:114 (+) Transcript_21326:447-788(+)
MLQSKFGATPRGDNLFSYRFTETMSCGTIPILYADDWLLPFRSTVLDWTNGIIIVPEIDTNNTLQYINHISDVKRCRMRQQILKWYDQYLADDTKVMAGIIESLEHTFAGAVD